LAPSRYVASDLFPESVSFTDVEKINLRDLGSLGEKQFDLIIHSQVIEHLRCNYAPPLFYLDRALSEGGVQVMTIPFMDGFYEEDLGPISPDEATARFGQHDHVRKFGTQDNERHLGAVISIPKNIDHSARFPEEVLDRANNPQEARQGWGHSSVMVLQKGAYKIA
jgi:phosphoglycolate phosphatase